MLKTIYTVNIINYLVFIVGVFYIYLNKNDFADLLIFFGITSVIAGVISLVFVFSKIEKVRYTGVIWFVVNIANILFLIPFIIFLLFFVI
ncbi:MULTISPECIES: hypothetical protein [Mammaliicoccus]|uniref:Uncharacterized protein n=1 Tax=Mammaliicoccus fleurettii TaxID=150056 RepID=A0ABS5MK06_9STAP|nr:MULTISPECIES: hypothetical protein [Mammaliicoccus]MBL0846509.1 hypothetical protein [Mammaliicoccus fleurettii]MBS3670950.1 hypothetical protein [Mammaliicoccus fleurettii]MBS3696009.1 hypothetical protein [Mammaliicoccus fleurettii]MEB8067708.1 hypothetical protein [Mammaliicoccus fleurettii]PTE33624.1 hypothetical protein BUY94_06470 [Mammaliicoccus fleurettii]